MNLDGSTKDIVCLPEAGEHVQPHLSNEGNLAGDDVKCFVGGWGTTEAGSQSDVLNSVNVNIMSSEYCSENAPNYNGQFDPTAEFCAGYLLGGKDSCQGDSGGPLICVIDGAPILYGVVSWGYGCADPYNPGVYAKVSAAVSWMFDVIGGMTTTTGTSTTGTSTTPQPVTFATGKILQSY